MKFLIRGAGVLSILLLAGCIPSLHPLYTDEDLVWKPALLGTWASSDDSQETWTFAESGTGKTYKVVFGTGDSSGEFLGRLVRVGAFLYLDLYPEPPDCVDNDFYSFHLWPVHTFYRVEIAEDVFTFIPLDAEEVVDRIRREKGGLKHEVVKADGDEGLIITAAPKEIQAFLLANQTDPDFFVRPTKYTRVREETGSDASGSGSSPDEKEE